MNLFRAIRWGGAAVGLAAAACVAHLRSGGKNQEKEEERLSFQIGFRVPVMEKGSNPPDVFLNASAQRTSGELSYWNRDVSVADVLDLVQGGKTDQIRPPAGFGDVKITWKNYRYPELLDFNGDGKKQESLVLRVQDIPRPGRETQTIAWLMVTPTRPDGSITPDLEKQSTVVTSYMGPEVELPIRGVEVGAFDNQVGTDIRFTKMDPTTRNRHEADIRFEILDAEGRAWSCLEADARNRSYYPFPTDDAGLIRSAAYYLDTVYEAKMGAYALSLIDTRFADFSGKVDQAYVEMMSRSLRPIFGELTAIRHRQNPVSAWQTLYADEFEMLDVLQTQLGAIHTFSEEENRDETSTFGKLEAGFGEHLGAFTFEGQKLGSGRAVIVALQKEPDGERRRRLWRAFSEHCNAYYEQPGNLYETMTRMNRYAQTHGFKNYADKVYLDRFGFTGDEFERKVDQVLAETRPNAQAYLAELSRLKKKLTQSDGTLYAWDIDFYGDLWLQQLTGGEEPTLTDAQALEVVHAVFKDLGVDLTKPPYDKIVKDVFKRDSKANKNGMALPAMLGRPYFTSDLEPDGKITLYGLNTILHEMTHCINFALASEEARGSFFMSAEYMPAHWIEGAAITVSKIVKDPRLARRYLKYPQFTEKFFHAHEQVDPLYGAFDLQKQLVTAWMEMNLYRDASQIPLDQRRRAWTAKLKETWGVVDAEDGISFWTARPHLTYKDYHLFSPAYPLGTAMTDRIYHRHLREGTTAEFGEFGKAILRLMRMGARITNRDIEAAGR